MWFNNLQLYRIDLSLDLADFEEQLSRGLYAGCGTHQATARGWIAPTGGPCAPLVYSQGHQFLIALRSDQRLLPGDVVQTEVAARTEALAKEMGYQPGRKALRELKERVIEELLPKAFVRSRITHAWIDAEDGWLAINTSSPVKAEEVIGHLRKCLDEFPLKPLHTMKSPTSAMADWLAAEEAPFGFTIDRDCELQALGEEKAQVSFKRHPLQDEWAAEIKSHLAAGKLPAKLALTWDDRISFVLTEKLELKRLAFLDLLKEQAEKDAETADDQFDADFALMTGELRRLLPQVVDALGGEVELDDETED